MARPATYRAPIDVDRAFFSKFLEDSENLPDPDVIAAEIVEDLKAALEQFAEIQADLAKR